MDEVTVYDSLKRVIRIEEKSDYDCIVIEPTYLLNIACKIEPKYISKELKIKIRNLNNEEIEHCYKNIKKELIEAMSIGYDKMVEYEKNYDSKLYEIENTFKFSKIEELTDITAMRKPFNYIYAKSIYQNNCLDKEIKESTPEEFLNTDEYSEELARDICSKLIVLEIEDYSKIYNILDKYYNLNKELVRMNRNTRKFIYDFIKLCNILFLETDSHQDEKNFNFKIIPLEEYKFKILNIVNYFDGYIQNTFDNNHISNRIEKLNSSLIDNYIDNNKENLNNFIFIISKLYTSDDRYYEFNYKEYNLNLISIIESLLVNSKQKNNIEEKFIKNVLLCLSINNNLDNEIEERKIIREIYAYRSCITHGNYCGYKNSLHNLEKLLNYKPIYYELNKITTIEYLMSKKINFYIKNIFEVNSKNSIIISLLKN